MPSETRRDWLARSVAIVSLLVSIAALVVSYRSSEYERRSADASEDEARPRLLFGDGVFRLSAEGALVQAVIRNAGKMPAVIHGGSVDIYSGPNGERFGFTFNGIEGLIVLPDKSVPVSVRLTRSVRLGSSGLIIDSSTLDPSRFAFAVTYTAHGRSAPTYFESNLFPQGAWDRENPSDNK